MKLYTSVPVPACDQPIGYKGNILLLGSCFATNIAKKLDYYGFHTLENPLGILYHPASVERLLSRAVNQQSYRESEVFFHAEAWHCLEAHSEMNRNTESDILLSLNEALEETLNAILKGSHLLITLGTAWAYRYLQGDFLVANCHKLPGDQFKKELTAPEEILKSLRRMVHLIRTVNDGIQIIFTVSPVRHLKDGEVGNQRSKAHLITALHTLLEEVPLRAGLYYFPSYELMMDELRDYRYYDRDLMHPNDLAIEYIWEKFSEACIAPEARGAMPLVHDLRKRLEHRPFNSATMAHREFQKALQEKIAYLKEHYPTIKLPV